MKTRFDVSREDLNELYHFYSCKKIGDIHGVCAEVVRRKLHEYKIPVLKRGGRRAFDPPKEVLEELYQSKSMLDIAKEFGVGETVVFKRIKEHSIQLKDHGNHRLKPGRVFTEKHKENIKKSRIANAAYGEKNPNWKGGLTEKNRQARGSWQYREWKKLSLERAGWKCEFCGAVDGSVCDCCGTKIKLHVHHIKSFSKYVELRFDPENSEVLCPKCHLNKHR